MTTPEEWQELGFITEPLPDIEVRAADGTVLWQIPDLPMPRLNLAPIPEVLQAPEPLNMRNLETSLRQMREAAARMAEMMSNLPPLQVQRGGIQYERVGGWVSPHPIAWDISDYRKHDPRQGEEVYVYDILPGARVYVLEDVFTVDRVELNATPPTIWLKELPTSPLYFTEDEYIYLANETED